MSTSDPFLQAAIDEARAGLAEGGIPIGSVLAHEGRIVGRGHNRRVQRGSAVLHGEMDALENAGRLPARVYRESTLYTTLSPCSMCSGAILLYPGRFMTRPAATAPGPESAPFHSVAHPHRTGEYASGGLGRETPHLRDLEPSRDGPVMNRPGYGIPRVVIGENRTFLGDEALLRERGVDLTVVDDAECIAMMRRFIADAPELWDEDIGV